MVHPCKLNYYEPWLIITQHDLTTHPLFTLNYPSFNTYQSYNQSPLIHHIHNHQPVVNSLQQSIHHLNSIISITTSGASLNHPSTLAPHPWAPTHPGASCAPCHPRLEVSQVPLQHAPRGQVPEANGGTFLQRRDLSGATGGAAAMAWGLVTGDWLTG